MKRLIFILSVVCLIGAQMATSAIAVTTTAANVDFAGSTITLDSNLEKVSGEVRIKGVNGIASTLNSPGANLNTGELFYGNNKIWYTGDYGTSRSIDPITGTATAINGTYAARNGIAIGGGHAWVPESSSLRKVDIATNTIVASIPTSATPSGVTYADGYVWAIVGSNVLKIDPSTHATVATIPIGAAPSMQSGKQITSGDGYVWFTTDNGFGVWRVNTTTNAIAATTSYNGYQTSSIVYGGGYVWTISDSGTNIRKINPTTNAQIASITTSAYRIAYGNGHLWYTSATTVSKMDTATNAVVQTITVGSNLRGVVSDGTSVWVVTEYNIIVTPAGPWYCDSDGSCDYTPAAVYGSVIGKIGTAFPVNSTKSATTPNMTMSNPVYSVAVTQTTPSAATNVKWLISTNNGTTWKKYSGGVWSTTTDITVGMTATELQAITPAQWDTLAATTLKFQFGLSTSDGNVTPTVSAITVNNITVSFSGVALVGDLTITGGVDSLTQTYTLNGSSDYGALTYKITLPNSSVVNSNSTAYTFVTGATVYTFTGKISLTNWPTISQSVSIQVTAPYPSPVVSAFVCDTALLKNAVGNCTVTATAAVGTLGYTWSGSVGSTVTPTGSGTGATISYAVAGTKVASVRTYLIEDPTLYVDSIASVEVSSYPAPVISAFTCDTTLTKNAVGSCTLTATAAVGTLGYTWSGSSGSTITLTETGATISFSTAGTRSISVRTFLNEDTEVYTDSSASIIVTTYPTPVVSSFTCSPTLWKSEVGVCTIAATSEPGTTISYTWSGSSGVSITQTGTGAIISFSSAGSRLVTVKTYLNEDPEVFTSNSASVTVSNWDRPLLSITGINSMYIGETAVYTGTASSKSGPVDITWEVEGATTSGSTLSYTGDVVNTITISATARIRGTDTDPDAASTTTKLLMVKDVTPPVVYLTVPSKADTGIPVEIKVTVNASISLPDSIKSSLTGRWVLPDGSYDTTSGSPLNYTFMEGGNITIGYEAWYGTHPDKITSRSGITKVTVYSFPNWIVSLRGKSALIAPYDAVFRVGPETKYSTKYLVPYVWDFGDGTTLTTTKTYLAHTYAAVGEYVATVTIADGYGNSQAVTTNLSVLTPEPFSFTSKVMKGNKFSRVPLIVYVRPSISGGHPKDRVSEYDWYVDGVYLKTASRMVSFTIDTPGDHTVSVAYTSKYGITGSGEFVVTAIENTPPTCSISHKDNTAKKATTFSPACTDPDGRILSYSWDFGDGTPIVTTSKGIAGYQTSGTYTVSLTATDDSGAAVTVTKDVTITR